MGTTKSSATARPEGEELRKLEEKLTRLTQRYNHEFFSEDEERQLLQDRIRGIQHRLREGLGR